MKTGDKVIAIISNYDEINIGEIYTVTDIYHDNYDLEEVFWSYPKNYFKSIKEIRKEKIKRLNERSI